MVVMSPRITIFNCPDYVSALWNSLCLAFFFFLRIDTGDHFLLSKIHSSRPINHGSISYALLQVSLTWDLYSSFTDEIKTVKFTILDP